MRKKQHDRSLTTEQRFWSDVNVAHRCNCWDWQGSLNGAGYGQFTWKGIKYNNAARYSYELHYGPILDLSMDIAHHCDNRACVNPHHLYLATRKENMLDCIKRGRISWAIQEKIDSVGSTPESRKEKRMKRMYGDHNPDKIIMDKQGRIRDGMGHFIRYGQKGFKTKRDSTGRFSI